MNLSMHWALRSQRQNLLPTTKVSLGIIISLFYFVHHETALFVCYGGLLALLCMTSNTVD